MSDQRDIITALDALIDHDVEVMVGGYDGNPDTPNVPAAGILGVLRHVEPEFLEQNVLGAGAEVYYVDGGQEPGNMSIVAVSGQVQRQEHDGIDVCWTQGSVFIAVTEREA